MAVKNGGIWMVIIYITIVFIGFCSYIMTPSTNPVPGSPVEYYYSLLNTARNDDGRTIGILKGRFRCHVVHRVLHYDPEIVYKIVIYFSMLHVCNRSGEYS